MARDLIFIFDPTDTSKNYLSNTNQKDAFESVESSKNVEQIKIKQEHYVPQIDYSDPVTFAKYGSARLYYKSAMNRILDYYPYDGSDAEINEFYNQCLDIERYIHLCEDTDCRIRILQYLTTYCEIL